MSSSMPLSVPPHFALRQRQLSIVFFLGRRKVRTISVSQDASLLSSLPIGELREYLHVLH
jgi:hypothetical protein